MAGVLLLLRVRIVEVVDHNNNYVDIIVDIQQQQEVDI